MKMLISSYNYQLFFPIVGIKWNISGYFVVARYKILRRITEFNL